MYLESKRGWTGAGLVLSKHNTQLPVSTGAQSSCHGSEQQDEGAGETSLGQCKPKEEKVFEKKKKNETRKKVRLLPTETVKTRPPKAVQPPPSS